MQRGGIPDTDHASRWLVQSFRDGKLGRWTLDGLGRGGEAVDDQKDFVEVARGHGDRFELWEDQGEEEGGDGGGAGREEEEGKEMKWTRSEPRLGYLSRRETAPPVTGTGDATLGEIISPPLVATPEATTPPPPPSSSSSLAADDDDDEAVIEPHVAGSVTSYLTYLASLASSVDLRSAHQSRKAKKADQAKIRDFKRKGHQVAKVKTYTKPTSSSSSRGGSGAGSFKKGGRSGAGGWFSRGVARGSGAGARKGPAIKLSSGRRRQYRR